MMKNVVRWLGMIGLSLIGANACADDLLIADFESDRYAPWTATGEAFGPGPAQGTLPNQMPVDGFSGQRLVNTFFNGDASTGTLTSPEFRIDKPFIKFFIGGGKNEQDLALQLIVRGQVVRVATGSNSQSGGSETLAAEAWDVRDLMHQTATLRIVDQAQGGWGHLNVDQIMQSDTRPAGAMTNAERTLTADANLLHFPIKNGGAKRVVTLFVDGQPVVRNDMELADAAPDWWAPMDISPWRGKTLTVRVDKLPAGSTALSAITLADALKQADDLYRESLRGQLRFSPRRGWNNDPNGMVFFHGEYHLFFQHNPYGWSWGNMHWGHAVSRDMVHWQELTDVLAPDTFGPMFSGSAVVDWQNTSGLGTTDHPPLVLIYTAAGDPTVQCIASSTDGRTFTKFAGNPVLKQITGGNRDPKVMWHEPSRQWVMVLYVEQPAGQHTVQFFTSPNLREWTLASVTPGDPAGQRFLFECPDFFELPVDGDAQQKKWVLTAADSQYAIGTFDGRKFVPEHSRLLNQRGRGFYAAQTFSDLPAADGRRIQIGWLQTETRGMPFNQAMTLPLELRLVTTPDGPRMTYTPVQELSSLRKSAQEMKDVSWRAGNAKPLSFNTGELVELRCEFTPDSNCNVDFSVRGAKIRYDAAREELVVNDVRVPAPLLQGKQRLTVYCDRTALEVFASDGLTYVPLPFVPPTDNRTVQVELQSGAATLQQLEVFELSSSWLAE